MTQIVDNFLTLYAAPKDWSPHGGLFWLTLTLPLAMLAGAILAGVSQRRAPRG